MSNAPTLPSLRSRALVSGAVLMALAIVQSNPAMAASNPLHRPKLDAPAEGVDRALHGRGPVFDPPPKGLFAICPVDKPRHYVDSFGDARYAGGYHRHQGIDIMAPFGTKIRAPFDGRAESSTSWAGGLQVYLYGRQGFVFNAHLTRVGALGKVQAGDVIGYVGNTGDARGGSPHDHFEWHPGGGAAVDAYKLLNAVCLPQKHRD